MSELATYFCSKNEYEVHLVLYGIKRDIFYTVPERLIIHKPNFVFDNTRRTWNTVKTLWFLRQKIKEIQPDAILSFGELWNNFVLLSSYGLGYPVYVSDRCQPNKSLGKWHDKLRNILYPTAQGIICQTDAAKRMYASMFGHKNFVVIGNPIRAIDTEQGTEKENIVLSVGRLIDSKHHDDLIRIFAEIDALNWRLVIVGDDALKQRNREKLEQLITDLQMEGRVILAGKRLDVDHFYSKAKIFAFTSSSEGFPNVIGEAMSAALPVVAYDCIAGPSDLIEDNETGFLIELHNKQAFKNALAKLINSEDLRSRLGAQGKRKIMKFSVQNIGREFENTILSARTAD